MAKLIRDLPSKLLAMGASFHQVSARPSDTATRWLTSPAHSQLLHLLRDPSLTVQQSSYDLVVRIAEKHVSDLVVEVELQTDAPPTIALPQELIDLLSAKLSPDVLHIPEQYAAVSDARRSTYGAILTCSILKGLHLPSRVASCLPLL